MTRSFKNWPWSNLKLKYILNKYKNNKNNQWFWNLEDYIIMVIISCFWERQNDNILKFHLNNSTYFEIRATVNSFKIKYVPGPLTRGNTVLVISRLTCFFLAKPNQGFFVFYKKTL